MQILTCIVPFEKKIAQVSQYANPHYTRTYIVPSPPYHQKVIMRPKLFMAQKCVKNAAATEGTAEALLHKGLLI